VISRCSDFRWAGAEAKLYKDTPGSHRGVVRFSLGGDGETDFQVRYFEVAPDGFTSFEMHRHEHCVVVLRGAGKVRLDEEWHEVRPFDVVNIGPNQPHQFRNTGDEPFGILCVVDKDRDRPILLDTEGAHQASS
jgi:quercetin dioxygenase-like cupin family protein